MQLQQGAKIGRVLASDSGKRFLWAKLLQIPARPGRGTRCSLLPRWLVTRESPAEGQGVHCVPSWFGQDVQCVPRRLMGVPVPRWLTGCPQFGTSNTTKISREDPQEMEERKKIVAGEGKKSAKCWTPRPLGPPPFGGPRNFTFPGPHLLGSQQT